MTDDWTEQVEAIAHVVSNPAQREVVKIEARKHLERAAAHRVTKNVSDTALLLAMQAGSWFDRKDLTLLQRESEVARMIEAAFTELTGNDPAMFAEVGSFQVGDRVEKYTGDYQIAGEVRAVFSTKAGHIRYVAEHYPGFLHIYSGRQLRKV